MHRIIAIANQKGGVGKTTTAVNLSSCLAAAEQKTLLIDMDPQANSTSGIGLDKHTVASSIYDVLIGQKSASEAIIPTELQYLHVIPSSISLVGAEIELVNMLSREQRLKSALAPIADQYRYIIIDCPPSLNLLTVNAMTAADSILIPLQCEYYAMEGLSQILQTIRLIQKNLNPLLKIEGILLTMFDARGNLGKEVATEIRAHFPGQVFETVIPRNVRLAEAPSHGKPIMYYDISSRGAVSYLNLAREWLGQLEPTLQEGER